MICLYEIRFCSTKEKKLKTKLQINVLEIKSLKIKSFYLKLLHSILPKLNVDELNLYFIPSIPIPFCVSS